MTIMVQVLFPASVYNSSSGFARLFNPHHSINIFPFDTVLHGKSLWKIRKILIRLSFQDGLIAFHCSNDFSEFCPVCQYSSILTWGMFFPPIITFRFERQTKRKPEENYTLLFYCRPFWCGFNWRDWQQIGICFQLNWFKFRTFHDNFG